MLQQFGDGIWIAAGPDVVAAMGFEYPTRMAVIRLGDGSLFIWSPVALTEELRLAVEVLGPVGHIVAPNSLHHVFVGDWQKAFATARTYAAPGLPDKRGDLAFDAVLADEPPAAWTGEIDQIVMRGNAITTEAVFFHRASGTAIFTDLIQQFPPGRFSCWRGMVARLDLMVTPEPTVPRKFRVAFTRRQEARGALDRILAWLIERLLMAHGTPVTREGHKAVEKAFNWLR